MGGTTLTAEQKQVILKSEEKRIEFYNDFCSHRRVVENFFVVSAFASIENYEEYQLDPTNLYDPHWRAYYAILCMMMKQGGFEKIDNFAVDNFVNTKGTDKLKKIYYEAGGFETIEEALEIVETDNIASYYQDVLRYGALTKMFKEGIRIDKKWDKLRKLTFTELTEYGEALIDDMFAGTETAIDKVYDIKDGIEKMIEDADKGINKGLPLFSNCLNSVVNGQVLGNITMLAGASGAGKTYLTLCMTMPSFIAEKEPLLIMCNEEDLAKWQRELLAWVINNVVVKEKEYRGMEFVKSRFYQGNFTKEEWMLLREAQAWVDKRVEDGLIKFVNFNSFSMSKAISLIRSYSTKHSFKYFIIDTLKLDNDAGSKISDNAWLMLQQNMVKLYNVIKPTNKNVHVWVTYQLSKSSKARFLDQGSLGMSKNVADVVSTLLLTRKVLASEKEGSGAIKVKRANKSEAILDPAKEYMLIFIDKCRSGSTSNQVVIRTDKGKNIIRDVGFTKIAEDY